MEVVLKLLVEVVCHSLKTEEIQHHDLEEGNHLGYIRSLLEAASVGKVCALHADRSFQGAVELVCCRIVDYARLAELESGVVGLEGAVGVAVGLGQVLTLVTFYCPLSVLMISDIP